MTKREMLHKLNWTKFKAWVRQQKPTRRFGCGPQT